MTVVANVVELEALKDKVHEGYYQSPGGDLDGMLDDIGNALHRSGYFSGPRLRKTGSRHHLVEAQVRRSSPNISPAMIRAELERLWEEDLRYDDYAAHAFDQTDKAIVFDFLTVAREARMYMTGMIVVDLV